MGWTEGSEGVYRKELSIVQKAYRAKGVWSPEAERENLCIYALCKVRFESYFSARDPAVSLRNAWKNLRFDYPALALVLDGFTAVYTVPNEENVERWVEQSFFVEVEKTADDIISKSSLRDFPALYYLPETSEILLLISHWRVDGIGTCMLLNRLITLWSQQPNPTYLTWGLDLEKLSPDLEDVVGLPPTPSPEIMQKARRFLTNTQTISPHYIGLLCKGTQWTPPGDAKKETVVFTSESTKTFIRACEESEITVSAAVYAALAETMFTQVREDEAMEYATLIAASMRAFLRAPYSSESHACQPCVSALSPAVRRDDSFAERTGALTLCFRIWCTDELMQGFWQIYRENCLAASEPRPLPPSTSSVVSVSNLGVVENYLSRDHNDTVHVEQFDFGMTSLTRETTLYVWTFHGRLHLSISYNDGYYDAFVPQELLISIQEVLEKELGLKLDT